MLAHDILKRDAATIEDALPQCLPDVDERAANLLAAMRYCLEGGKRLRGVLVLRCAAAFDLDPPSVMPAACAFEMLHAATLVHDDMPCIDDSDLRRGRASLHVAFDQHTALLAADALIIASFEQLAREVELVGAERACPALREFAEATGAGGLIGGEQADIIGEELPPDRELVRFIHVNKTAKLIRAACRTGALLAGAEPPMLEAVSDYGMNLGLLFQVTDDLLDVVGDAAVMGKPTGADAEAGKQTYPAAFGLEGAREQARDLADRARAAAARLPGQVDLLQGLAELVVERER